MRNGEQQDLFGDPAHALPPVEVIGEGAVLLRRYAIGVDTALMQGVEAVALLASFRHMVTPGGKTMSVLMTNCGDAGWVSDRHGYRYTATDPQTDRPWPAMPHAFTDLARRAAAQAGYAGFQPDVCLINCYAPGARMALHQDRDERDYSAPIVSVSLGLPAVFLVGGLQRTDRPQRYPLLHGDVVVWGGPLRQMFHGIAPLAAGEHPLTGRRRINLTLRKAL